MKGYNKLRKRVLAILHNELMEKLYYHSEAHTLAALHTSKSYIKSEKIAGENAKLLRVGILLHDIGFTISTKDHEAHSVEMAEELMTVYEFSKEHIAIVKGLILATQIPQTPKTQLERVICDVDLDYLGKSNYYKISELLFKELNALNIVNDENDWRKIQLQFLENHHYHTNFGIRNRQPEKEKRIEELKLLVKEK